MKFCAFFRKNQHWHGTYPTSARQSVGVCATLLGFKLVAIASDEREIRSTLCIPMQAMYPVFVSTVCFNSRLVIVRATYCILCQVTWISVPSLEKRKRRFLRSTMRWNMCRAFGGERDMRPGFCIPDTINAYLFFVSAVFVLISGWWEHLIFFLSIMRFCVLIPKIESPPRIQFFRVVAVCRVLSHLVCTFVRSIVCRSGYKKLNSRVLRWTCRAYACARGCCHISHFLATRLVFATPFVVGNVIVQIVCALIPCDRACWLFYLYVLLWWLCFMWSWSISFSLWQDVFVCWRRL